LDAVAGRDFLSRDGDQAFNAIKKLIATYSSPTNYDSSIVSIDNRLNTLETRVSCLKENYNLLREHFDYVAINLNP
jgi:hypothetical protein